MNTYYDAFGNVLPDSTGAAYAMDASGNTIDLTGVGNVVPSSSPVDTSGAGSGVGSGVSMAGSLGTLFSNLAVAASSVYRTVTGPSTNVINPRTGQPYTQAQLTALAQQNAALGPIGGVNIIPIALVVLVAIILLRR